MSTKPKAFRNPLEALAAGMRLKPSTTPQHKVDRRTIPRSRIGQGKRGHPIGSKPLIPLKKRLGNPNKPKMHGLQPMFWCGIEGKWIIDKKKIRISKRRQEWVEGLAHTLHPLGLWPGENTKTDVTLTRKVQENLEMANVPDYHGVPVRDLINDGWKSYLPK